MKGWMVWLYMTFKLLKHLSAGLSCAITTLGALFAPIGQFVKRAPVAQRYGHGAVRLVKIVAFIGFVVILVVIYNA